MDMVYKFTSLLSDIGPVTHARMHCTTLKYLRLINEITPEL